jgi:hypothetical protein
VQFDRIFIQHAGEFNELISQPEALMRLLQEKRALANRTAEAESGIGAARGSIEVMGVVLGDKKHQNIAFSQPSAGHPDVPG